MCVWVNTALLHSLHWVQAHSHLPGVRYHVFSFGTVQNEVAVAVSTWYPEEQSRSRLDITHLKMCWYNYLAVICAQCEEKPCGTPVWVSNLLKRTSTCWDLHVQKEQKQLKTKRFTYMSFHLRVSRCGWCVFTAGLKSTNKMTIALDCKGLSRQVVICDVGLYKSNLTWLEQTSSERGCSSRRVYMDVDWPEQLI